MPFDHFLERPGFSRQVKSFLIASLVLGFAVSGYGQTTEPVAAPATPATPVSSSFTAPQVFVSSRIERSEDITAIFNPAAWDLLTGMSVPPPINQTVPTTTTSTNTSGAIQLPSNVKPINAGSAVAETTAQPTGLAAGQTSGDAPVTYLDWDSDALYVAAIVPNGSDLVLSFDGNNDGFLIGNDNLELRVKVGQTPSLTARIMDGNNRVAPTWLDASGYVSASAVSVQPHDGTSQVVLLKIVDPGYGIVVPKVGSKLAMRVDLIASAAGPTEAFLPRALTQLSFVTHQAVVAQAGIEATIDPDRLQSSPGTTTEMPWNFSSTPTTNLVGVATSMEAPNTDLASQTITPLPALDAKFTTGVSQLMTLSSAVKPGVAVLDAEVTGKVGAGATATAIKHRFSFTINDDIEIDASSFKTVLSPKNPNITSTLKLYSHTDKRVQGSFEVIPPTDWRVIKGTGEPFYIYSRKGHAVRGFVLAPPPGAKGSFPIILRALVPGKTFVKTIWITIL